MFLNKSFSYTTSNRIHLFIGMTLGVLILFVLFFLKPFDSGTTNFPFKKLYLIGFGLLTFSTYMTTHLFSVLYFKKFRIWKRYEEIIFCLVFIVSTIILAFFYTELLINNNPERLNISHFLGWFETIFLGFGILLMVPTVLLRERYARSYSKNKVAPAATMESNADNIIISGSLKKDSLVVDEAAIVYIKAENNYIRIFYFKEALLKEKLLRGTLAQILKQLPSFIKVHRSYLVNPSFVDSVKGNKQNAKVLLKRIDQRIPVSKPFFEAVHSLFIHHK